MGLDSLQIQGVGVLEVGCAVRTEKNMQAVDSWCAWRTLQTWLYLNAMILRHIRASLTLI